MTACASGCTIRGEHLADCDGTDDVDGETIECRGCLPRPAEVGVLCPWCWSRLQSVVRTMPALAGHLAEMGRPSLSSPMGGGGAGGAGRPSERSVYPAALGGLDDLHAMLASWCMEVAAENPAGLTFPAHLVRWTEPDADGDREPVGARRHPDDTEELVAWLLPHLEWAAAQEWAGAMLSDLSAETSKLSARWPVEEPSRRIYVVRCPQCQCASLAVNPPAVYRGEITVTCSIPACSTVLSEDEWSQELKRAVAEALDAQAGGAA